LEVLQRRIFAKVIFELARMQDKFVSHTMMEEEQAKLDRILEKKGESNVASPLEPLIVSLLKGFVDDADLSNKLQTLYKALLPSRALCESA
jgi:hypothetical protein